jgi:guanylate kinase
MSDQNKLQHLHDFQKLITSYKPNIEVIELLSQLRVVLLVAPAAAGRNTIIRNLIMTGKYYYLISDTTRKPRINNGVPEHSGGEYWFRSEQDMLESLRRGEYVEAAVIHEQQVSGTSIHELRIALQKGLVAITDIDLQGCDSFQLYGPNTEPIFILPPDFNEWMRRMDGRGVMDPHEKRRRLQSAVREINEALKRPYFKFVINWDLRSTSEELHQEIISGVFEENKQNLARQHAEELLTSLHRTLN